MGKLNQISNLKNDIIIIWHIFVYVYHATNRSFIILSEYISQISQKT